MQMASALLIVAHGSRRAQSNAQVHALAQNIAVLKPDYAQVKAAFLELSSPSISQAIDELYHSGIRHVVVFPHFLAAGAHVVSDVPKALEKAQLRYKDLRIQLREHLGGQPQLAEFIAQQV